MYFGEGVCAGVPDSEKEECRGVWECTRMCEDPICWVMAGRQGSDPQVLCQASKKGGEGWRGCVWGVPGVSNSCHFDLPG
jgi:hypothetical protein